MTAPDPQREANVKPTTEARETKPKPTTEAVEAVPYAIRVAAAWSWRLLFIAAAVAGILWLAGTFRTVVVPVLVAALLAVLLGPVVDFLVSRARFPRVLAVVVTLVGLLAVVAGLLIIAGRSIAIGLGELWTKAQAGFDELLTWLAEGPLHLSRADMQGYLDQISKGMDQNGQSLVSGALSVTVTVVHVAAGALITLFCLVFFLLEGDRIWRWLINLLPERARERCHQAGIRGWVTLRSYTHMQIVVAAVDAIGIGLGAAILGVPLALPLGILVFVGSFIPIVGAFVTGAVAVLVALVDQGPVIAVIMLGVVLLVQQIEGHVLHPFLMGRAVRLHPVAVLLAVATGSLAAGIIGALFAVPIAAVLNTVIRYLNGSDPFPQLATAGGGPAQPVYPEREDP